MTDESDAKVSRRYRELGAEEPPRALDEAILAASRRPARSWTQRWAVPLSLAAVLVLSVTVTLRIQHEQPGIELPVTAPKEVAPALPVPVRDAPLKLKAENRLNAGIAQPERDRQEKTVMRDEPKPIASERREQARPAAAAPEAAPAPAPAPAPVEALSSRSDVLRGAESSAAGSMARQVEERTSRDAEAAARAPQVGPVQALAKRVAETPERELERIAQLRREGRHEEADKALAEFRKRYADYKIPAVMLERVERR